MLDAMKPYRQTVAEQETVIRWDRESPEVQLFSANPAVWRKMTRLGIEPARRSTLQGEEAGRFYRVPITRFRWGLKSEARSQARRGRRPGVHPRIDGDSGPDLNQEG
jgi:hypothetical protein